ncbi:hypothetical protein D8674_034977 [Pyrus ussuriensis x Pyrus communis]|uniref:Uncharacterized protein n=1 Tax=Pyrus ussuriensis x Pyrus communis TaxID=2448454 RepID=A0A5N5GFS6_9ROSA|nr:hypothetical protein D8674_034977 [Pyrus ussuriensis x Pyrus communis]
MGENTILSLVDNQDDSGTRKSLNYGIQMRAIIRCGTKRRGLYYVDDVALKRVNQVRSVVGTVTKVRRFGTIIEWQPTADQYAATERQLSDHQAATEQKLSNQQATTEQHISDQQAPTKQKPSGQQAATEQ